ncbi:MAG TPA: pyruvate kinase [Clostridiales bacterium]|nr:pyruvate kinase [Clostridiales bacterium]
MRKTKIICTLGPSTDNPDVLREMMKSGMDVARINMSHQSHESHLARINMVKEIRQELGLPVAILIDTKGPEIRLGAIKEKPLLKAGDKFILTTKDIEGVYKPGDDFGVMQASVSYKGICHDVRPGGTILVDDGLIELRVEKTTETEVHCTVINGGFVTSNKGINIPGAKLSMPFMSQRDRDDIRFACEVEADFIAASFTRRAEDVLEIRHELERNDNHSIRIIAKIENKEGVDNIDEIIKVSDGIMIARGDLGVEIEFEKLPAIQKSLIHKGYNAGLQVITATQMLDSMMKNPRPTRAETTDVANAIYDGTSAIMLSGETAAGAYPVESVRTMARIAISTEQDINYKKRFAAREMIDQPNVTNAISHATVTTAHDLGAAAIIAVTKSGATARMISKYRPACPIICCTPSEVTMRQMNLSWGVIPVKTEEKETIDDLFEHAVEKATDAGLLRSGDLVVITAGVPLGISGTTNLLKVHLVGNILVEGTGATQLSVCGNLCVASSEEEALRKFRSGDILVIPQTSNNILPLLKECSGIITEAPGLNSHAAIVGMALDKPVLVNAKGATQILKSGTTVTLDAGRGIVISGGACSLSR